MFEHLLILFWQRDALDGGGIFVLESGIADLPVRSACGLFDDIEKSPGTKIIFFDIN